MDKDKMIENAGVAFDTLVDILNNAKLTKKQWELMDEVCGKLDHFIYEVTKCEHKGQ